MRQGGIVLSAQRVFKPVGMILVLVSGMAQGHLSRAEPSATPESQSIPILVDAEGQKRVKTNKKNKKVRGEKEAEGTEAADRFEANTVLKSKYSLNGESLEVDPD